MTVRLPFTLTPLDGEPFDVWLHAYAARLAMVPSHLADALGIAALRDQGNGAAGPPPVQLAAACAATGLAPPAVTAMFAAAGRAAQHRPSRCPAPSPAQAPVLAEGCRNP
jgi:hypothetical protein